MNNQFQFQSNSYDNLASAKKAQKNGFAIASLAFGIISLLSCCCCTTSLGILAMGVSAIVAIVLAFLSKKNSNGKMDKKAVAGLTFALISLFVILCFAAAVIGLFTMIGDIPQAEMMTYLEENVQPIFDGNEATYNEIVEAIKAIYATRGQ